MAASCQAAGPSYTTTGDVNCWVDGELDEIWDWEPATRILDVFETLHAETGLGSVVFLAVDVPPESELDVDLTPRHAQSPDDAAYEVIIVSHDDEVVLEAAQADLGAPGRPARDRVIAGMLGAMAEFVESQPERDKFVFARTL